MRVVSMNILFRTYYFWGNGVGFSWRNPLFNPICNNKKEKVGVDKMNTYIINNNPNMIHFILQSPLRSPKVLNTKCLITIFPSTAL